MRISTSTGKIEISGETRNLQSFDEFLTILKVVETAEILGKHVNPLDIKIIVKILGVIMGKLKIKNPEERAKAQALTQQHILPVSTKLPVFTAVSRYNRQDLALALSHVFYDDLPCDLLSVTDLTEQGAVVIATALLTAFNPMAIPNDLEAKENGVLGEFVSFEGKPMAFYNAVETKRPFQHQTLLGKSYYDSKRYHRLQELLEASAGKVETIYTTSQALPASNPPEELLTLHQEPVGQEEDVHELHIQEVEIDSDDDDFLEDTSFIDADSEFVDADKVEVMDIDVGDEPSSDDLDWMKDVVVKGK
jgi:hypothetical protein